MDFAQKLVPTYFGLGEFNNQGFVVQQNSGGATLLSLLFRDLCAFISFRPDEGVILRETRSSTLETPYKRDTLKHCSCLPVRIC